MYALVILHQMPLYTYLCNFTGNSLGFMINDDRFILGCLDNWEFGPDNTGDIMKMTNLDQLKVRTSKSKK